MSNGISFSSPEEIPEILIKMRNDFAEKVSELKAETESTQDRKKSIRENVEKDDDLTNEVLEFFQDISSQITAKIDENPALSVVMFKMLEEVKEPISDHRELFLTMEAAKTRPNRSASPEDKKSLEEMRKNIESLYTVGRMMAADAMDSLEEQEDEDGNPLFPLKEKKKDGKGTGEYYPDLPSLHGIAVSDSSKPRGKGAQTKRYLWEVDGEELPIGTLPLQVGVGILKLSRNEWQQKYQSKLDGKNEFNWNINGHDVRAFLPETEEDGEE